MTDLLPCPFCGFIPDSANEDCIYPIAREKTIWELVCYETGGGCDAGVLGKSKDDVIKRWNKRAKPVIANPRRNTRNEESLN